MCQSGHQSFSPPLSTSILLIKVPRRKRISALSTGRSPLCPEQSLSLPPGHQGQHSCLQGIPGLLPGFVLLQETPPIYPSSKLYLRTRFYQKLRKPHCLLQPLAAYSPGGIALVDPGYSPPAISWFEVRVCALFFFPTTKLYIPEGQGLWLKLPL